MKSRSAYYHHHVLAVLNNINDKNTFLFAKDGGRGTFPLPSFLACHRPLVPPHS